MIFAESVVKYRGKMEGTIMGRPTPNRHRHYWEGVGLDTLLALCVALPIAGLVFVILHI